MARRRPSAFEVSFPDEAERETIDSSLILPSTSIPSKRRSASVLEYAEVPKRAKLPPTRYYTPRREEVREAEDLILEGEGELEEDDEDTEADDKKPVRILFDFSFFDPRHRNEMLSLNSLEESSGEDSFLEGAGYAIPYVTNDEDEGQEDDGLGDQSPKYLRLSAILRYTIDYTKATESFYVETTFAWYILKTPSEEYLEMFKYFYTPRRVAQLVLSKVNHRHDTSVDRFLSDFTSTTNIFGDTYNVQNLLSAAKELDEIIDELDNSARLRQAPLMKYIFGRTALPQEKASSRTRHRQRDHAPPRFLQSITSLSGNPDLAVLKIENQNPTHVTPLVAQIAQGFIREELVVVGPKPTQPSKAALDQQRGRSRQLLRACVKRARKRKEVDYRKEDRLYRGSPYIRQISVDGDIYKVGDFVLVPIGEDGDKRPVGLPDDDNIPDSKTIADFFWFARIVYIKHEERAAHVQWLEHGSQILFRELAHPQELFLDELCGMIPLETICGKVTVHERPVEPESNDYFFRFVHDIATSSFISIDPKWNEIAAPYEPPDNCPVCLLSEDQHRKTIPQRLKDADGHLHGVAYQGHKFHLEDFVLYRSEEGPAHIGHIKNITFPSRDASGANILVRMKKFGRIVDLGPVLPSGFFRDERHVYLTKEEISVPLDSLVQRCFVVAADAATDLDVWKNRSPFHFYARFTFQKLNVKSWTDKENLRSNDLDVCSTCMHDQLHWLKDTNKFESTLKRRSLRTLDLFAGVGAFSLGMAEGGNCVKVTHAVEISPSAAASFKRNSPDTIVYNQCANVMLRYAIKHHEGHEVVAPNALGTTNTPLPPPPALGKIDMIVAGFPCQTHSGLNMFKNADDIKSNLILNAISWVDHYQPKYCYFENVPGFLNFGLNGKQAGIHKVDGGILMGGVKLLVRAMTEMGYQCRFALLQAGHYGTPQGRVRFFLIAARDGLELPELPQPTHSFAPQTLQIRLPVPEKMPGKVIRPIRTTVGTAAHPFVNIDEAISDLPRFDWKHPNAHRQSEAEQRETLRRRQNDIPALKCDQESGYCGLEGDVAYHHDPVTSYQKRARRNPTRDIQHYTKCVLPKKVERVIAIPMVAAADYRSLRPDLYEWQFANPGSSVGKAGYKPGLYARLDAKGVFPTTVTNVDPTAKQSRVIHPFCKRMVTVRELARSQGFPDDFVFESVGKLNIVTLHRQIGNAVPWPVGIALGRELRNALFAKWRSAREQAIYVE